MVLHTENGMLGMGGEAVGDEIDADLTNAGKVPVTETAGASYFHHADSFAMMRGGHLDVCVLGAFQVSQRGDLANWHTGAPDAIPAVGGAMDLAIGAKSVFVMMNLFAKDGTAKLVRECTYPLTGLRCVSRVYTDHAIFAIDPADDGGAAGAGDVRALSSCAGRANVGAAALAAAAVPRRPRMMGRSSVLATE